MGKRRSCAARPRPSRRSARSRAPSGRGRRTGPSPCRCPRRPRGPRRHRAHAQARARHRPVARGTSVGWRHTARPPRRTPAVSEWLPSASSLAAVSPSRRDPPLGSTSLTGAMARVTRTAAQVACALTVAVMLIPGSAARAGVMRIGRRPVVPVGAVAKGAVAPRLRLHVTVTLKPRNPAALNAYAEAVSTPGSRSYRHYLTPSQFGRRFGATAAEVRAVRRGLRAQGLDPGSVTPGSLSIPVFATAARLERALRISLRRLALPGRRTAVAANAAPAVQASAAGAVQAVVGLDTVSAPHPLLARPASSVASSGGGRPSGQRRGRPSGHRRERPSRHRLDRPSPPERTSPRPAPTHAPRPRPRPPRSTPTRRTRSPRRTDSTASMTRATSGAA